MAHFDIASKNNKLKSLEEMINQPDFWDDQNKALSIVNEKNELDNIVNSYFFVQSKIKDVSETYDMIKEMYDEVEKADFFLTSYEPDFAPHLRYITTGTSGAFQLVYGFLKPVVIHEKFSGINGFDDKNSVIYSDSM